jgi:hypothetical protein
MSLVPMTELEAVNRLLEMIEEAPVNTLIDFENDPDVGDAIFHLRRASFDFQAKGWAFNTIPALTLPVTSEGYAFVPSTVAAIPGFLILGDRKLYSISEGTEVFEDAVTAVAYRLFEFNELPAEAAAFIFATATETFLFNKAPGSQPPDSMKEDAWVAFHSYELRLRDTRLPQPFLIQNRPRAR